MGERSGQNGEKERYDEGQCASRRCHGPIVAVDRENQWLGRDLQAKFK